MSRADLERVQLCLRTPPIVRASPLHSRNLEDPHLPNRRLRPYTYACASTIERRPTLARDVAEEIEDLLDQAQAADIPRVEAALRKRRRELGLLGQENGHALFSEVVEYRPHEGGMLQAEVRRQRNKDGAEREFGPYWYYKHYEGGHRLSMYLGKTDDPEGALEAKRAERRSS